MPPAGDPNNSDVHFSPIPKVQRVTPNTPTAVSKSASRETDGCSRIGSIYSQDYFPPSGFV